MSKSRKLSEYPDKADDIDLAVEKSHDQNTDTALDQGGENEISADQIKAGLADLSENKADKAEVQALDSRVGDAEGRLDTAEDEIDSAKSRLDTAEGNIQGLESSKADQADLDGKLDTFPNTLSTTGVEVTKWLEGDWNGSSPLAILLAPHSSTNADILGHIYMTSQASTRASAIGRVHYRSTSGSPSYRSAFFDVTNASYDFTCELNRVTYEGIDYVALCFPYNNGNWNPRRAYFRGFLLGDADPVLVRMNDITVVSDLSYFNGYRSMHGRIEQKGDINASGYTVTASDFITQSRVESDREDALSLLDNIGEWKKKDGSIDYKKHYAYTPRVIRDGDGKVIEEIPGLSVEKRIAMLEKALHELGQKNKALETKLNRRS